MNTIRISRFFRYFAVLVIDETNCWLAYGPVDWFVDTHKAYLPNKIFRIKDMFAISSNKFDTTNFTRVFFLLELAAIVGALVRRRILHDTLSNYTSLINGICIRFKYPQYAYI